MSDNFTFISNGVLSTYSYGNQGSFNQLANVSVSDSVSGNIVTINTTSISISNSTANIAIIKPSAAQISSSNFWLNANGQWAQIVSAVSTLDANNSNYLLGKTWSIPGTIGLTTANSGNFTTLSATSGNVTTITSNTISANSGSFANISVSSNLVTIGTATYHVSNGNMGIGNSAPVDKLSVNGSAYINGVANIVGSLYAPIFYDSNNVSYYVNPASNTNLYGLTVEQTINGSVSGNATNITGTYGGSLTSTQVTNALGYTPLSSVTNISGSAASAGAASGSSFFTTGGGGENQVGCNLSGYNPVYLFSSTSAWGLYSGTGSFLAYYNRNNSNYYYGNGNAYVDSSGYFHSSNIYAPIFYDSIDGAYYLDPNSSSNLLNVRINSLGVGTNASGTGGEIRATNEITAYYSDQRLKDEITTIKGALAKVESLVGVTYTQNKLAEQFGYNNYRRQVGLLAQDVEKVLPEAIRPAPFDVDENGNSKSGENYLTVKYENVVPLLVEAIKELSEKINVIENKLNGITK